MQPSIDPLPDPGSDDPVQRAIDRLGPWFHNLHLPDGSQTAPQHVLGDFPNSQWQIIKNYLPERLEGKRILDVGCNAGFYSLALARRGAQVAAVDVSAHYLRQARWAAGLYGLRGQIQFEQRSVYDLAKDGRRFDGVLFMGVFYHLRHPLLALDLLGRRVRDWLIFQTMLMPDEAVIESGEDRPIDDRNDFLRPGWPRLAFIERRLAGDPTNWWVANHAGVLAMLRSSGLEATARIGREIYFCRPLPFWNAGQIDEELMAVYGHRLNPADG